MSSGKPVWLSDEVLDEIRGMSQDNESPNQTLERVLEVRGVPGLGEEQVREIVRDEVVSEALSDGG